MRHASSTTPSSPSSAGRDRTPRPRAAVRAAAPGTAAAPPGAARTPRDSRKTKRRPAAKPLRARLRQDWQLLLMTVPALGLLLVFHYIPTRGNIIAFQDYSPCRGIWDSPFVGF